MTLVSYDDKHKKMQVSEATSQSISEALPSGGVLKTQDSDTSSYSRFCQKNILCFL
jgi:hypothetical protein